MALLFAALPTAFQGSTPEQALEKFAAAISARDFATVSSLVVGGSSDLSAFAMFQTDDFKNLSVAIKVDKITITEKKAIAQITSTVSTTPKDASDVKETVELTLQEDGAWKLVPPKNVEGNSLVGMFSYSASNPDGMKQMMADAKKAALSTARLSNMKQIATALMMFLADNDDNFPKSQAVLKKELDPYLKTDEVFKDPATKKLLPIFINPALLGKNFGKVKKPAETPMAAWGQPGALWFDERGYTYVAFSDGHVKRFDKAGAAKLRWNP